MWVVVKSPDGTTYDTRVPWENEAGPAAQADFARPGRDADGARCARTSASAGKARCASLPAAERPPLAAGSSRRDLAGAPGERDGRRERRRRGDRTPARPLPSAHVRRRRRRPDRPAERQRAAVTGTVLGQPPPGTRLLRRAGAHRHASRSAAACTRVTVRSLHRARPNAQHGGARVGVRRHDGTARRPSPRRDSETTRPGGGLRPDWHWTGSARQEGTAGRSAGAAAAAVWRRTARTSRSSRSAGARRRRPPRAARVVRVRAAARPRRRGCRAGAAPAGR